MSLERSHNCKAIMYSQISTFIYPLRLSFITYCNHLWVCIFNLMCSGGCTSHLLHKAVFFPSELNGLTTRPRGEHHYRLLNVLKNVQTVHICTSSHLFNILSTACLCKSKTIFKNSLFYMTILSSFSQWPWNVSYLKNWWESQVK